MVLSINNQENKVQGAFEVLTSRRDFSPDSSINTAFCNHLGKQFFCVSENFFNIDEMFKKIISNIKNEEFEKQAVEKFELFSAYSLNIVSDNIEPDNEMLKQYIKPMSFDNLSSFKTYEYKSGYKNNFIINKWVREDAKGLSFNLAQERFAFSDKPLLEDEKKFLEICFDLIQDKIQIKDLNEHLINNAWGSINILNYIGSIKYFNKRHKQLFLSAMKEIAYQYGDQELKKQLLLEQKTGEQPTPLQKMLTKPNQDNIQLLENVLSLFSLKEIFETSLTQKGKEYLFFNLIIEGISNQFDYINKTKEVEVSSEKLENIIEFLVQNMYSRDKANMLYDLKCSFGEYKSSFNMVVDILTEKIKEKQAESLKQNSQDLKRKKPNSIL